MYKHVNGVYTNDDCSEQKTVRMDAETIGIVEGHNGKNFSDKLRNLIKDFARQNQDFARQKAGGVYGKD